MKHAFRGVSAVVLCLLLVSCGLLKKKGEEADADVDAAVVVAEVPDATPPPVAGPIAANEADIARFPDETKLDGVAATIKRFTNVREQPVAGKVVSSLGSGATVTEIAQRPGNFLIVFDDPKDATRKLMGWVTADAFAAAVVEPRKPLACAPPEVPLQSDIQFCGRVCTVDANCPAGQACKGSATVIKNGKPESVQTTVCVASQTASPNVAVQAEAGGGGVGGAFARIDAAAPPAAAAPFVPPGDIFAPPPGGCPVEFVLTGARCHKRCKKATDCRTAAGCIKCSGIGVCGPGCN